VPRAPRPEPQAARDTERPGEADGVPIAERLAQAGVGLVGIQGAGEDLGEQGVATDHDGRDDSRAEERGPAVRRDPHERHAGREHDGVRQRPAGLDPAVGGVDGPCDRQPGEDRQRRHQHDGEHAVAPATVVRQDGDPDERSADEL
jgi:hypothetical protein